MYTAHRHSIDFYLFIILLVIFLRANKNNLTCQYCINVYKQWYDKYLIFIEIFLSIYWYKYKQKLNTKKRFFSYI